MAGAPRATEFCAVDVVPGITYGKEIWQWPIERWLLATRHAYCDGVVERGWEEVMEERDIQQRFHLVQQEVEAAISLVEELKLTCAAATDALKIEVEVLRRFMERSHPDFPRQVAELRTKVLHDVNPEWIEPGTTKHTEEAGQLSLAGAIRQGPWSWSAAPALASAMTPTDVVPDRGCQLAL
jgi:hypothetical protein